MRRAAGTIMAAEIAEQPQALARLLDLGAPEIARVRRTIFERSLRGVVIAARGTSDHAALYVKYLAEIKLGLPAGLASMSAATLYGAEQNLAKVLFVAVSQSGDSPDLVESTRRARLQGATTLAILNDTASPLAEAAEHVIDIRAGRERAVAATKSYTSQLLACYLLVTGDLAGARAVVNAAARTLAFAEQAHAVADRYRLTNWLVTVGRGYSYPTAREAALKLMETSYLSAHAFSGADLLHGPLAMIDHRMPVIAVVSGGVGARALEPVLDRVREAGAEILRVGPGDELHVDCAGLTEELLPVVEIMPLQQMAWRLALDRGHNPDRPRGLEKVTQTL